MMPLASILSSITSMVGILLGFIPTVLIIIGATSVVLRAVDKLVESRIAKHPEKRLWIYLDRALDRSDAGLGWVRRLLDAITLDTQHRSQQ